MGSRSNKLSSLSLFRVTSSRFPAFDGGGTEKIGGRWNSPGKRVIYCSASVACCRLEIMVRVVGEDVPLNRVCIEVAVPSDTDILEFGIDDLPYDWNHPLDYAVTQKIGDKWYDAGEQLLLKVPSVVSPEDSNYLINQKHPDFSCLSVSDPWEVKWDERLFKRGE